MVYINNVINKRKVLKMNFIEKVKSDLECLNRVLSRLKENDCDDKSIAVLEGMIEGTKVTLEGLK